MELIDGVKEKLNKHNYFENLHIKLVALFYSFFFVFQDFEISLPLGIVLLSIILLFYFIKERRRLLDFEINKEYLIAFFFIALICVNIKTLDIFKTNPMYFYSMLLFLFCVPYTVKDKGTLKFVLISLLIPAFLSSFIVILAKLLPGVYEGTILKIISQSSVDHYFYLKNEGYGAILGSNISLTANYLSIGIIILFYSFFTKPSFKSGILSFLLLLSLVILNRRGELLATFLVLMIMLIVLRKKERNYILSFIFIFVPLLFIITFTLINSNLIHYEGTNRIIQLIFDVFSGDKSIDITNGRSDLYKTAFNLFLDHPVFGIGWGQFRVYGAQLISQVTNVHNIYLQVLCEMGIIGFVAFMLITIGFVYLLIKNFIEKENIFTGFAIFLVSYILIVGLFDNPIFQDQFWLIVILVYSIYLLTKKQEELV